jgi:hypothetical protein
MSAPICYRTHLCDRVLYKLVDMLGLTGMLGPTDMLGYLAA